MEYRASDTRAEWLSTFSRIARLLPQPSASCSTSLSQARDQWQCEMKNILEVYALASTRCNEFAPANTLPHELMSKIFGYLAPVQRGSAAHVMRVCRRWNTIALETASLWVEVSVDGREPLDMFFERSKGFPLHVAGWVRPNVKRDIERLRTILSPAQLLRLKTLNIASKFDINMVLDRLLSADDCYAPKLEVLALSFVEVETGFALSPTFISSRAPRLEEIRLRQCLFPWGVGSSSLRSLRVEFDKGRSQPSFVYTLDEVLESLVTMPNLQVLKISNALPRVAATEDRLQFITQHNIVRMPYLVELSLKDKNGACWELWALLEVHPFATVDVIMRRSAPSNVIAAALLRHTHHSRPRQYPCLELFLITAQELHVKLMGSNQSKYACTSLEIKIESLPHAVLDIVRAFPLEKLEVLRVRGEFYRMTVEDLASLFSDATQLTHLELCGFDGTRSLCSLLLPPSVLSGESTLNTSMPFPNLRDVCVSYANDLRNTRSFSPELEQPTGKWLELALAFRHKAGYGLQRLSISSHTYRYEGFVEAWKTVVKEVFA